MNMHKCRVTFFRGFEGQKGPSLASVSPIWFVLCGCHTSLTLHTLQLSAWRGQYLTCAVTRGGSESVHVECKHRQRGCVYHSSPVAHIHSGASGTPSVRGMHNLVAFLVETGTACMNHAGAWHHYLECPWMCLYSIVYSTGCLFHWHLSSLDGYVLFGKIQISPGYSWQKCVDGGGSGIPQLGHLYWWCLFGWLMCGLTVCKHDNINCCAPSNLNCATKIYLRMPLHLLHCAVTSIYCMLHAAFTFTNQQCNWMQSGSAVCYFSAPWLAFLTNMAEC